MTQHANGMGIVEQAIQAGEARVNVTYAGQNGDLDDTVSRDAADGDVRQWVAEALRAGSIRGIAAQAEVDLTDFVVDRFPPTEARPHALISLRPKVPFGGEGGIYDHERDAREAEER